MEGGHTVTDDPLNRPVEGDALVHLSPLRARERQHVTGEAHHPQEGVDEGIVDAAQAVRMAQHRPDLRLPGQDHPMQVGGNDGNFRALMGVGERGHVRRSHEGRLQPVPARGAVFDVQPRHLRSHVPQEAQRALHVLPQALAQAVRIVAAHADAVVVIHLDVCKAAPLQKPRHPLPQVGLHLLPAHVQEAAVVRVDHHAPAFEQHILPLENVRTRGAGFRLKPDARLHPRAADGVRRGLQPLREQPRFVRLPVAAAVAPAAVALGVPARVHDHDVNAAAPQAVGDFHHVLVGGHAPGGAVFVEHHGQRFVPAQPVFPLDAQQPLGYRVHAALAHGQVGFGALEGFPGLQGFAPVAIVLIRQAQHQAQAVVLAADLPLPGGGAGQLHGPGYPGSGVLRRRKGKPLPHRHGADLPELLHPEGMPRPGALQVKAFDAFTLQASFGAPGASNPVDGQRAAGILRRKGRDAAKIRAGQKVQGEGRARSVLKHGGHPHRLQALVPGHAVIGLSAGIIRQGGHDGAALPLLPCQLHAGSRRGGGQGMAVAVAVGQLVPPGMALDEALHRPLLVQHIGGAACRDQHQAHMLLLVGHIARQHVPQVVFAE